MDKLQDFGHTFQVKSIASLMMNQSFLEQIHDILDEEYCKVKRIIVMPKCRLSYQYHYKRV